MEFNNFEIVEKLSLKLREKIMSHFKIKDTEDLVRTTIKALGGKIVFPSDSDYDDYLSSLTVKDGTFYIKESAYTSPLRDNYELSREIGRFLFCYEKTDDGNFNRLPDINEVYINRFAATFLMPRKEFDEAKEQYKNSSMMIAAHFHVTADLVEACLKCL